MVDPKLAEKLERRDILVDEIEKLKHKEHIDKGQSCGCMAARLISNK